MTVDTLGRAVDLYRRTAASRSAIALVVANLIPLVGVLFFGWSLMTILVLYWVENGIVGFWNVPKIAMARGSLLPRLPDMPDAAALGATGSPERAAALQAAWRRAQDAQARGGATDIALADLAKVAQLAQGGAAASGAVSAPASSGPASPAAASETANGPASPARALPAPALSAADDPGQGPGRTIVLSPQAAARLGSIPRMGLSVFFLFHYGMFWLGHGLFVFLFLPAMSGAFSGAGPSLDRFGPPIPMPGFPVEPGFGSDCASPMGDILWGSVVVGAIALFISHGASFLFNYIGRGEYLTKSPAQQMAAPYGRVVVLHLTIIFGGMIVAFLGAPIGALLVLVALKTAFDLTLHLKEHRAADRQLPPVLQGTT